MDKVLYIYAYFFRWLEDDKLREGCSLSTSTRMTPEAALEWAKEELQRKGHHILMRVTEEVRTTTAMHDNLEYRHPELED